MARSIVKVSPTLVIGLGGTGALAVQYTKRKIREMLQTVDDSAPKRLPFVEYLVLDTNRQEELLEELLGDEFINMGNRNFLRALAVAERDGEFDSSLRWFPRKVNPGQIDAGARGVRKIGRLCFFFSRPDIKNAVCTKIRAITNYELVSKALAGCRSLAVEPNATIDVHIVSSLCGGTGSSCVLDTAYLTRTAIDEVTKKEPKQIGHLVTTEPIEAEPNTDPSTLRSNMLVTLAEIEHFCSDRDGARGRFSIEYLDSETIPAATKPFSLMFLLGASDAATRSRHNVCRTIAEEIALQTVSPENGTFRGRLENVIEIVNKPGAKQWYSSYNIRTVTSEVDGDTKGVASAAVIKAICDRFLAGGHSSAKWDRFEMRLRGSFGEVPISTTDFVNYVWKGIDLDPSQWQGIVKVVNKPPKTTQWGWHQRARVRDRIREMYNLLRADVATATAKVRATLTEKYVTVRRETDRAMWEMLSQGESLETIRGIFDKLEERVSEMNHALATGVTRVDGDISDLIDKCLIQSDGERFRREAPGQLVGEFQKNVSGLVDQLSRDLLSWINECRDWCVKTRDCIVDAHDELKRTGAYHGKGSASSLWDATWIAEDIERQIDALIKSFLSEAKSAAHAMDQRAADRLGNLYTLSRFDRSEAGRVQATKQLLKNVASKYLRELEGNGISYPMPGVSLDATPLSKARLTGMFEAAAPAWQIERGGSDIKSVNMTNCPEQSAIGNALDDASKRSVEFPANHDSTSERMLWLIRSEHGVPLRRLSNLSLCIAATKSRLKEEGKISLNDLCLDPRWNIADPAGLLTEETLTIFSMGLLFRTIGDQNYTYAFTTPDGRKVELTPNCNPIRRANREETFYHFAKLIDQGDRDVVALKKNISGEVATRQANGGIALLRPEVQAWLVQLEGQVKSTTEEAERRWWKAEARAIQEFLNHIGPASGAGV